MLLAPSAACWEVVLACVAANLLFPFWKFLVAFWQGPALQCPWTAFYKGPQGHQPHYPGAEVPSPLPACEDKSAACIRRDCQTSRGAVCAKRNTKSTRVTMKLSYSFIQ